MKAMIFIPDPLLRCAEREAEVCGVTLSILIADALRSHLSQGSFHLPGVRGELVDSNLDLDRTSDLLLADDEAAF